jgi:hypothetical protein
MNELHKLWKMTQMLLVKVFICSIGNRNLKSPTSARAGTDGQQKVIIAISSVHKIPR